MNKTLKATLLASLLLSTIAQAALPSKKVAIIIPLEIQAMTEISQGFESTLKAYYPGPLTFKVVNAQGDSNLLHANIQSLRDQAYDLLVPIGANATNMTLSMVKNTPIVSLASDLTDSQRQSLKPCNVAIVHDEISTRQQLTFMRQAFPSIKKIVLIHSAAETIFPEVKEAQAAGVQLGLTITPMLAPTLLDLQTIARNIPNETQAIFILKDMQIVSGIAQLAKIAQNHKIPLMSSDDGSVKNGASFALGIHENQTGINGALLAAQILTGTKACTLPISEMLNLTVFVNPQAMQSVGASMKAVQTAAVKLHYSLETI